jgi:glycosyltransferase involved in cell wall biosynthesis
MVMRRFTVLMTCGVFDPGFRGGGKARAVVQAVDSVSEHVELTLVTQDRDVGFTEPYPGLSGRWTTRRLARAFYLNTRSARQWLYLWQALRRSRFDLLHVNSLWAPSFTVVPVLAAKLGFIQARRILLSPHGELSPGALSLKRRKKRAFLALWGRLLRRLDVTWHATTEMEAREITAVLPWARVMVHHLQVPLPEEPIPPTASHESARLVYIGRVSPKKNLELVLHALQYVSLPVEFHIHGPVEDAAYWSRCQSLIRRLPDNVTVQYRGTIPHYPGETDPVRDVLRTFSQYDAFVFPTLSENFGYIVAESLSASCPVICSDSTPWDEVISHGGGVILPTPTAAELAKEIDRIAIMTPDERLSARRRAGAAYRAWRRDISNENLLDHVRRAGLPSPDRRTG